MPVAIKGTGGGSVTLTAGAAAADTTLTLPNTSGTVALTGTTIPVANGGTGITSTGAVGNVLFTTDGSTWSATQKIVAGTAQASTSGTSIDFTSIPSWVKRVTVMFNGVSTTGASAVQIQIGSGSFTTTGYSSSAMIAGGTNIAIGLQSTTGLLLTPTRVASDATTGTMTINNISGNIWISMTASAVNNTYANCGGGSVSLSGTLDRVRITTVGGTDTFDAGSINIMYE